MFLVDVVRLAKCWDIDYNMEIRIWGNKHYTQIVTEPMLVCFLMSQKLHHVEVSHKVNFICKK